MSVESFTSHLVSKWETPMDSFTRGTTVRLDKPHQMGAPDARSPIIVGHVVIGGAGNHLFVGSPVRIKGKRGSLLVLDVDDVATVISQDYNAPCCRGISRCRGPGGTNTVDARVVRTAHGGLATGMVGTADRTEHARRTPGVSDTRIHDPGTRDSVRDRCCILLRIRLRRQRSTHRHE